MLATSAMLSEYRLTARLQHLERYVCSRRPPERATKRHLPDLLSNKTPQAMPDKRYSKSHRTYHPSVVIFRKQFHLDMPVKHHVGQESQGLRREWLCRLPEMCALETCSLDKPRLCTSMYRMQVLPPAHRHLLVGCEWFGLEAASCRSALAIGVTAAKVQEYGTA